MVGLASSPSSAAAGVYENISEDRGGTQLAIPLSELWPFGYIDLFGRRAEALDIGPTNFPPANSGVVELPNGIQLSFKPSSFLPKPTRFLLK